MEKIKMSYGHI